MHLPIERYAAWRQFDDRASARTKARGPVDSRPPPPLEAYQSLPPLAQYPRRLRDGGFHPIFGSTEQPPLVKHDHRLPGLVELRREVRRTGRRLAYPRLGLTVLGIDGTAIVLEGM
jgi:hypothetical protein